MTFHTLPVLDAHIHYDGPASMLNLIEILDRCGIGKFNVVCTPHTNRLSLVPDALHLKAHYPERVYVFGGLDISAYFILPDSCGAYFADYLDTLVRMGCDGVKMIEGKPGMRKSLSVPPFDGSAYAPYWAKMEALGLPLVFHVNDPEEFWDPALIPDWAVQQGWFYGDGSFVSNEVQYSEILNVLRRHPGLKMILAHFFFLSNQLPRLAGYLDEFPNMHVDLTPGVEMYYAFARNPAATRDFFLKYQDRIIFGTDIGAKALLSGSGGIDLTESQIRVDLIRTFLEADGEFRLVSDQGFLMDKFAGPFHGICLPTEVLEKIYHRNFERLAGDLPRPLDPDAIIRECDRLATIIPVMGAARPGEQADPSVAEMISLYFRGQKGA